MYAALDRAYIDLIYEQGLRVAIAGPGSIESVKWTSRSRANRFGLMAIPRGLHLLVATIVGLLRSHMSHSDQQ